MRVLPPDGIADMVEVTNSRLQVSDSERGLGCECRSQLLRTEEFVLTNNDGDGRGPFRYRVIL